MNPPRGRSAGERKSLEDRVSELENWRELWADPKVEAVEKRVEALVSFQRLVLSCAMVVGACVGFFATEIKRKLGMLP